MKYLINFIRGIFGVPKKVTPRPKNRYVCKEIKKVQYVESVVTVATIGVEYSDCRTETFRLVNENPSIIMYDYAWMLETGERLIGANDDFHYIIDAINEEHLKIIKRDMADEELAQAKMRKARVADILREAVGEKNESN